jgi:hypothetical protein
MAFVRALIFAVVFFGLGSGGYWLIRRFLPEILEAGNGVDGLGAQVDISVDDEQGDDSPDDGLGDFMREDTPETNEAAPMDQHDEDHYTAQGNVEEGGSAEPFVPSFLGNLDGTVTSEHPAKPAGDAEDVLSGLADLSQGITDQTVDMTTGPDPAELSGPRRPLSATADKPPQLEGDFRPRELAQAIQTLLKRE